ncbi:MAG TPA: cyclase family protein, partial [Dehalococcoidia bacterium]|nr:cyclase family protein [Dehalococcoidia bacterium]
MTGAARSLSFAEFDRLFDEVKNWGRWGAEDERGALNLITAEKRRAAASLVRDGIAVSCALPLATQPGPENPSPVVHLMAGAGDQPNTYASFDYFAIAPHGMANTHLDALCHIFYRGQMYNGFPCTQVTSTGALACSIEAAEDGVVSRGVLLDVARTVGKPWLEPGEAIYVEDLEAAERRAGVRVEEGD